MIVRLDISLAGLDEQIRHSFGVIRALLTCSLLVFPLLHAEPKPDIVGKVVGVHDGDTLTVLTAAKEQVKVRLDGIDAPELKQAFGNRSKEALSALIFGKPVVVRPKGSDRYKRSLGRVIVGGLDVNLQMVKDGFAWHFADYSKDAALAKAQVDAKSAKRGLWADAAPVPPWDFRKPEAAKK